MEGSTWILEWTDIRQKRKDQSHNVGLQDKQNKKQKPKQPKSIHFSQCFHPFWMNQIYMYELFLRRR